MKSKRGIYVITFPPPNECVRIPPIKAESRTEALVEAMENGGFSLKPAVGGLTVWTIEEWERARRELGPDFFKQMEEHCKEQP